MHQLLADLILILHAGFIAFVAGGFVLILLGMVREWSWVRNVWFRLVHLGAIGFVVAEAWLGQLCPLTEWESDLRQAAGDNGYSASFVEHWLEKWVYYDLAPWVFTGVYTCFGTLVLLTWILMPPRRPGRTGSPSPP